MKLNKLVLMCGLVMGACCGGAAVPEPIQVPIEAFAPKGGHIQGMAVTEDAIYLSQQGRLIKIDWQGKVLKTAPVLSHTGDLCWWKGELFAAVAAYGGPHKGKGLIQVYDADLKLVREKVLDRTIDGIACREGVLYVGMGAKVQPSKDPHRVNIFGRFDAKTLEEVGTRFDVDYGFDTNYGAQDVVVDDGLVCVAFYAVKGAPNFVAFDKDMKAVKTAKFRASNGVDLVPVAKANGASLYLRANTAKKGAAFATLDFLSKADVTFKQVDK